MPCNRYSRRRRAPRLTKARPSVFPRSMINLAPAARSKAIEIANALLEEGYQEGRAIRIAITASGRSPDSCAALAAAAEYEWGRVSAWSR